MSSFEFVIDGPPISQQARQREGLHAWKDLVREEAKRLWPRGSIPSNATLRMTITYYYEDSPVDVRGIVKPITDALIGLIFNDNSQIDEISQSRQDLHGSFRIPDFSPVLAEGFGRGGEFLHVKIDGLPPLGDRVQETGPEVRLQDSVQTEPPQMERLQPETVPLQGVQPQSIEFSPEETTIRQAVPPYQDNEPASEPPEFSGQDLAAEEIVSESSQTPFDENLAQSDSPGEEMVDQEAMGAETQIEAEGSQEGEELRILSDQEPAIQSIDAQGTPDDSLGELEQPVDPEDSASIPGDQEN